MNSSEEIDFQTYVESAKQRKTPWIIFETLMKDLTYSNIVRLKRLNAMLLIELTIDYSDLDRLKYLNSILLTEFKELIEREGDNFQNTSKRYLNKSIFIAQDVTASQTGPPTSINCQK